VNLLSQLIELDTLALQLRLSSTAVRLEKKVLADAFIKKFNIQTPSHSTFLHAEAPRTDVIYNILKKSFQQSRKIKFVIPDKFLLLKTANARHSTC
jgi:hypothetical protein